MTGPDLIVATITIEMTETEDKAEAIEADKATEEEATKETTTTVVEEIDSEITTAEVTEEGADQVVAAVVASEEAVDNSQAQPQNLPFQLVSQFL